MMGMGTMEEQLPEIEPAAIKDLLARVFRKKKWQRRLQLHAVFRYWDEIVGTDISGRARPACLRGSVLWVEVADSIWMQQLHLQKLILLDLINRRLGVAGIYDIRFKLNSELDCSRPAAQAPKSVSPPDERQLEEFERHLAPLRDEDIKNCLRRLWAKFHTNL